MITWSLRGRDHRVAMLEYNLMEYMKYGEGSLVMCKYKESSEAKIK